MVEWIENIIECGRHKKKCINGISEIKGVKPLYKSVLTFLSPK